MSTGALARFPEHRRVLAAVVTYYQDDPRVEGMLLGGSNAAGGMDFFSDVDLDVVVTDAAFDAVFAERDRAVEAVGRPLFRFIADHIPGGDQLYIVLYESPVGPVKLDVEYYRASAVTPSWSLSRRRMLLDRTGALAAVLARSAEVEVSTPRVEHLRDVNQKFWSWCWYTFGKIVRGELWEAVDALHTIRTRALIPFVAWAGGAPVEGYRRLEQKADPDVLGRLAATLAPPQRAPLYAALQVSIDLYSTLREPVFSRFGVQADVRAESTLRQAIVQYWAECRLAE
ncbi:MAG: aminoglycoside 6-adenylyltransferase [Chloroflexi bacterium]|nr:aminoglycoside 6-adenylyltransferase [Chloroflexota bacterium]